MLNLPFMARNRKVNKAWSPWFIPSFDNFTQDDKDLLLCPCRCLKMYLKKSSSYRLNNEALFITYQEGYHKPASTSSISRWIVSTIKHAYCANGLEISEIRAHDTRKLSTSRALFNGASLKEIFQAAHCSSAKTVAAFYLKDVSWGEENSARSSILRSVERASN